MALAVGAAAIGGYYFLPSRGQSIAYVVIGVGSLGCFLAGVRLNVPDRLRLGWYVFAAGFALEVVGDAVGSFYELFLNREPPTPGLTDVLYLGGYPFLVVGAILLVQRVRNTLNHTVLYDTLAVFLAVTLVQWVFFIDRYNHAGVTDRGVRLVDMAYPAMDVILLVALGQLLVRYARNFAFQSLLVGVGLLVAADEIYAMKTLSYGTPRWLDLFYLGSYVALGVAALDASAGKIEPVVVGDVPRLARGRLALRGAALLTPPGVLLAEEAAGHRVHMSIGIFGVAIALVVMLRFVELFRDADRARAAEAAVRRESETAQQLLAVQNQRLRELDTLKDEFLSSVSHELRTPLTSIQGYVELLREDEGNAMKRGYLDIIERNSERLLGLVADVLFAARVLEGQLRFEFQPVDVGMLAHQAVEEARPRATRAGIELMSHDGAALQVDGEPARLSQLLDNLVSNAIKFTPSGGRVEVRTSGAEGFVRIEVSDTGVGLSAADRDHLFERFFRSQTALERQIQGTGLGLYISRAIVEAHGGRIGVTSVEGEGTTFLVELPARA